VSVGFDPEILAALDVWCREHDRKRPWAVQRAVRLWLRQPGVLAAELDGWRVEPTQESTWRTVPETRVSYLRNPHSAEGGHEIAQGGRAIRVLPDGRTSGQRRSRLITGAVAACEGLQLDVLAYVWGVCCRAGVGVLVEVKP
jgi:hypothetical protein